MRLTPSELAEMINRLRRHYIARKLPTERLQTLAEFLCNLELVAESGDGWSARCPGHPDNRPSLSIDVRMDGRILVCCHRGCEFEDIVRSAGMIVSEMFDTAPSTQSAVQPPRRIKDLAPRVKPVTQSWDRLNGLLQKAIDIQSLDELANELKVTLQSLLAIGVGWSRLGKCWTFPEWNGERTICGIVRRYPDGRKLALAGSNRGLTLPAGWDQSDRTLHICEGASDVAAAISHGWRAIGRPGLASGFNDLAVLLKNEPADIVVVADNDPDGNGRAGAEKLAKRLANALKRPVQTIAPKPKYKDLREFLTEKNQ